MSLIRSNQGRRGGFCRCGWRVVSVLLVGVRLVRPQNVQAVITLIESHETFANTMDGNYGRSFVSGYEYYARLQQVGSLCVKSTTGSNKNTTVVEPADQLPVALLVSSHENVTNDDSDSDDDTSNGCSLQTQIDYVLNHVSPPGRVKYLIVATAEEEQQETTRWWWWPSLPKKSKNHAPPLLLLHRTDEPLYILHVSTLTYDNLYRHLERQTENTVLEGGTQISMDDNRHSHRYYNGGNNADQNEMILTTALIAFVTAGVCFLCLILCGAGDWDDEDHGGTNATAPPRPVRQRLTKEQVQARFPVYRYDGQSKLVRCVHCPPPTDTTTTTTDSLQQPLLPASTPSTLESSYQPNEVVIENIMLDVCSICLDEYERLDKVRILPCQHTFHSKCVGRWLSERSAVCPLCKENYYIAEEEEEAAAEDAPDDTAAAVTTTTTNTTTLESSSVPLWRRVWEHFAAVPPTAAVNTTTTTTNVDVEMPSVVPEEAPNPRVVAMDTSISTFWWSCMFPQVTMSSSTSTSPLLLNPLDSLTEPLLQPPPQPAQDDHVTVPPAVESTVTDNSNARNRPGTTTLPPLTMDDAAVSPSHDHMTTNDEVGHDATVEPSVNDRGSDTSPVVPDP